VPAAKDAKTAARYAASDAISNILFTRLGLLLVPEKLYTVIPAARVVIVCKKHVCHKVGDVNAKAVAIVTLGIVHFIYLHLLLFH